MTSKQMVAVSIEQLKKWHRDLDAYQKVIWLRGGFDPAYCSDAQDCLKEMEAVMAAPEAPRQSPIGYVHQWELDRIDKKQAHWATLWNSDGSNNPSRGNDTVALYTAPLSPDHSGGGAGMVAISAAKAFGKGFNLLEQADGKYSITMAFQNSDEAFAAYRQMAELRKCLDKVKELNQ